MRKVTKNSIFISLESQKEKRKKSEANRIYEKIMAENPPNLVKDT